MLSVAKKKKEGIVLIINEVHWYAIQFETPKHRTKVLHFIF
jgi:hypothetical protein